MSAGQDRKQTRPGKTSGAVSHPSIREYLGALDRLGLSMPVVNIDHIPVGDAFDDCLTIAQWVDVVIHDQGRAVAGLVSLVRFKRMNRKQRMESQDQTEARP